jgi:hypothetical protein
VRVKKKNMLDKSFFSLPLEVLEIIVSFLPPSLHCLFWSTTPFHDWKLVHGFTTHGFQQCAGNQDAAAIRFHILHDQSCVTRQLMRASIKNQHESVVKLLLSSGIWHEKIDLMKTAIKADAHDIVKRFIEAGFPVLRVHMAQAILQKKCRNSTSMIEILMQSSPEMRGFALMLSCQSQNLSVFLFLVDKSPKLFANKHLALTEAHKLMNKAYLGILLMWNKFSTKEMQAAFSHQPCKKLEFECKKCSDKMDQKEILVDLLISKYGIHIGYPDRWSCRLCIG